MRSRRHDLAVLRDWAREGVTTREIMGRLGVGRARVGQLLRRASRDAEHPFPGLSVRARNILSSEGCVSVEDVRRLLLQGPATLSRLPNCGVQSQREIRLFFGVDIVDVLTGEPLPAAERSATPAALAAPTPGGQPETSPVPKNVKT